MTAHLKGLTVCFEDDIREDDAQAVIAAIKMVKGVADVVPLVSSPQDWLARVRVRGELSNQILDVLMKFANHNE